MLFIYDRKFDNVQLTQQIKFGLISSIWIMCNKRSETWNYKYSKSNFSRYEKHKPFSGQGLTDLLLTCFTPYYTFLRCGSALFRFFAGSGSNFDPDWTEIEILNIVRISKMFLQDPNHYNYLQNCRIADPIRFRIQ